jgi:hypothetical protein
MAEKGALARMPRVSPLKGGVAKRLIPVRSALEGGFLPISGNKLPVQKGRATVEKKEQGNNKSKKLFHGIDSATQRPSRTWAESDQPELHRTTGPSSWRRLFRLYEAGR